MLRNFALHTLQHGSVKNLKIMLQFVSHSKFKYTWTLFGYYLSVASVSVYIVFFSFHWNTLLICFYCDWSPSYVLLYLVLALIFMKQVYFISSPSQYKLKGTSWNFGLWLGITQRTKNMSHSGDSAGSQTTAAREQQHIDVGGAKAVDRPAVRQVGLRWWRPNDSHLHNS